MEVTAMSDTMPRIGLRTGGGDYPGLKPSHG
jgi:hypothetical protein